MDVSAFVRYQLARPPPGPRPPGVGVMGEVVRWLAERDDFEHHVEWGYVDARRLLFLRYLIEHGGVSE